MLGPVLATLRRGQRLAESLMVDSCVCVRPGVKVTLPNGDDGFEDVPVYSGRCKVQSFRPYETNIESAGRPVVTQRLEVHVPVGTGPFKIGDVFTVEGHSVPLRVAGVDEKSMQSAQRLLVDQQSNRTGA